MSAPVVLPPALREKFQSLPNAPTHSFPVLNHQFTVPKKYTFIRELGVGAYGVVCAAHDTELKKDVAIKKVNKVFERKILAKRTLRELKLLRHFLDHENIISIADIMKPQNENFSEIYLVQELMEADMHQIIRSGQSLTDAHFQYFIYQILRGLKYIHSANVLHRDLKPGNLLVNADCELKICDFGLARGFTEKQDDTTGFMTEYVATRWYRAPEIMLSFLQYTKAIDIWSVGCIFAEMLGGKPLFAGRDYVHQLNLILGVLGSPAEETVTRIGSRRAQEYIRSLPKQPKVPFTRLYPNATPTAIDLLEKMLQFDPATRITVEEALAHPYLATYHDAEDEPTAPPFDFAFEACNKVDDLRVIILDEVLQYHTPVKMQHLRRNTQGALVTDPTKLPAKGQTIAEEDQASNYVQEQPKSSNVDVHELEKDLSGLTAGAPDKN